MKVSPEKVEQRVQAFKEGLKQAGVRVTHQRLEVFRELASSEDHPEAEKVFHGLRRRLPTVSLDTVYRTLWLLLDLGLIDTLGGADHQVRFDGNSRPHHHFVCRRCGLARDFASAEFDRLQAPGGLQTVGRVENIRVEVRGLCQKCSEKINSKPGGKRPREKK